MDKTSSSINLGLNIKTKQNNVNC